MTDSIDYATTRQRAQRARYRKAYDYRRHVGVPTSLVAADAAAEHLRTMVELGWSGPALEQLCGGRVSITTLMDLAALAHPTIERATEAAALAIPLTLAPPTTMDGITMVPTLGARRRVEALLWMGWPHRVMHSRYDAETTHLTRRTYLHMIADRWRDIDAMYRDLCMTPGPSTITTRRARAAGYVAPLGWDDIDDPTEQPVAWEYQPATRCELLTEMLGRGDGITQVCRHLRISSGALQKWCAANQLAHVYRALSAREALTVNQYTDMDRVAS